MFTTLLIDGAIKLARIIRYRNKPAVCRIYDKSGVLPEKILIGSSNDPNRFLDEMTCKEYKSLPGGLVAL